MSKKEAKTVSHTSESLFGKENYIWMVAGVAVIAIGMLLMSGGKSSDAGVFDQKEIYSTTRITIAPLLILAGLALEVVAIFKKPKA
ncbi:DUF3098 domain-containing protein [Flavihumibacter stibioxidans]|uniref:DUF3098 domain-containing protein n=1 Tax=Flavihumibacter stibioxidans TaxID=1834163 RepID=A0ABR7M8D4_9BACT|nr:DUF3098 domain-containing protein [Flavihumibacter stibioxidans]MBC6490883.1 hypothetical protein [Flavihumibacter stibioxidans]